MEGEGFCFLVLNLDPGKSTTYSLCSSSVISSSLSSVVVMVTPKTSHRRCHRHHCQETLPIKCLIVVQNRVLGLSINYGKI